MRQKRKCDGGPSTWPVLWWESMSRRDWCVEIESKIVCKSQSLSVLMKHSKKTTQPGWQKKRGKLWIWEIY